MRLLPEDSLAVGGQLALHTQFLNRGSCLHKFVIADKLVTPLFQVELIPFLNGRLAYLLERRSLTDNGVR